MNFVEKLKELYAGLAPFLRELLAEKIIPNAIKKGYEAFNVFADEKIEALAEQVDKYENAVESAKRDKYRRGIELGANTLRMVAEKLNLAADEFMKAIE